jgi:uncharacterized iron-regulated membrane protein
VRKGYNGSCPPLTQGIEELKIKRVVFWAHLCTAVAASIFILVMSVTGLLLAYERQIIANAQQRNQLPVPASAALSADQLGRIARDVAPPSARASLTFTNDPAAPVAVSMGRAGTVLLNPYTGAVMVDASIGVSKFFTKVEDWHRFLNLGSRATGTAITGAANFMFLLLAISGIYIWMPDAWRWPAVKFRMFFKSKPVNSKVRDFNWHHVFSFWMVIPLFLIALSGVVISYGWASNLVYAAFGEQPPQRIGPPGEGGGDRGASRSDAQQNSERALPRASLDTLLITAKGQLTDWRTIAIPLAGGGPNISVNIERRSNERRPPRSTLVLNTADASVVSMSAQGGGQSQQSPGQRLRIWFRFVHTGEEYGVIGQTVAGIASLAACFLVYTGLALAYRRLIKPLFRCRTAS